MIPGGLAALRGCGHPAWYAQADSPASNVGKTYKCSETTYSSLLGSMVSSQKIWLESWPPGPQSVTLLRNRAFARYSARMGPWSRVCSSSNTAGEEGDRQAETARGRWWQRPVSCLCRPGAGQQQSGWGGACSAQLRCRPSESSGHTHPQLSQDGFPPRYLLTPRWTANPTRRCVRSQTLLKPHNSAPGMREQRSPLALHGAAPRHGWRSSVALPLLALPRVCHPTRNEKGPRASLCNSPGTQVIQNKKRIRGAPPQATLTDFPGFSGKLRTALSSVLD